MFDDRSIKRWIGFFPMMLFSAQWHFGARLLVLVILSRCWQKEKHKTHLKKSLQIIMIAILFSFRLTHPHMGLTPLYLSKPTKVVMQATLCSLPRTYRHYTQIEVCSKQINQQKIEKHLLLSWSKPHPKLIAGSLWQLTASLKPPHALNNPGGPPLSRHWFEKKHIDAVGHVIKKAHNRLLEKPKPFSLIAMRQQLKWLLEKQTNQLKQRGMIMALTLGNKDWINNTQWTQLQHLGINHLLALSGMHLGFLCGMTYFIFSWLWRRSTRLCLFRPAPLASSALMMLFGLIYTLLVGAPASTKRAWLMLALWKLNEHNGWHWPIELIVVATFNLFVILDPSVRYDAGFWLSYAAVLALASSVKTSSRLMRKNRFIDCARVWLKTQARLWLFMLPVCLYFFNQYTLIAPISNAIAIPVVTLLVLPCCLIGLFFLLCAMPLVSNIMFIIADKTLSLLMGLLSPLDQPICFIQYVPHDLFDVLIATLAVSFSLLPHISSYIPIALLLMLPFLTPKLAHLKWGEAKITALDVGQGLSVVIQTQKHLVVFDAGMRFDDGHDRAKQVIIPFVRSLHRDSIDVLIISHEDLDHRGGADTLIKNQRNLRLYANGGSLPYLPKHTVQCASSESFVFDGVFFNFLTPYMRTFKQSNNNSCVLHLKTLHGQALIPGDIEKSAEESLIARYGKALESDLLIAAHHGSKTSSSEAWIDTVKPKTVVFATGKWNRFHFPHPNIVKRFNNRGIRIRNTNKGAVGYFLP